MKLIKTTFLAVLLGFSLQSIAEYVSGYYKSNGTYVNGYNRSNRNASVKDNYSYFGNTNPYTGSKGTNKYYNNPSSDYYRPYRTKKWR